MTMTRRSLLATASLAALCTAFSGEAGAQAKTTLTVRVDRDADVLDPAFRTGVNEGNIIRCLFQRLVSISPGDGEIVLDAAAEIKQVSPTVVEFKLKPGQMFTDGYGEMTTEDVKFSFERFAVAPVDGKESPYKADWVELKAVEIVDKYAGRIVLNRPRASLFAVALADGSGCIVSKKAVLERGIAYNLKPVGSGPMMLVSLERQRQAVLKRNPAYLGPRSGFEEVVVRFVQDPKTTELALRAGEIDFASLPPSQSETLAKVSGLKVEHQPGIANVWMGINIEKPPFTDIRVRRAVRMALDVDQMLLAGYDGKAARANCLVMPEVVGYWKDAPAPKRDVAGAKKLLAEAGMPNGFKTRITVLNQPVYQTMALVAQALLKDVGITVEIEGLDGGAFFASGKGDTGKNLDMFIIRFNGKLDPNFLAQWFVSSQVGVWNWQRWASPEYDALFDQAAVELDVSKRAALMVQAQKLMEESAAFIWLTYDVSYFVSRSWLKPALLPSGIDWALDRFAPV
jgi:peptide/nickel transport system substrate-binding protein